MARFVCPTHGEVEKVSHGGYSLGHSTSRQGPNELDLEGITFTFEVVTHEDDDLELALVDAGGARNYLSKFADWEEEVTKAAENSLEHKCGKEGCNELLNWVEEGGSPP